jgi:putative oxidoreductase
VSHYLYVIGALQVAGGVLLLIGRQVPLGLTLLAPVIVNILCFHVLMAPAGLPLAIVVSLLALFLLWRYRDHFAGLVKNAPVHSDLPRTAIAMGNATVNQ